MLPALDFLGVTFCFDTLVQPLVADLTVRFAAGWTGIVGPNGAGKTTVLRLAVGELAPQSGRVIRPRRAVYCSQRTDAAPAELAALLAADEGEAHALRGRLGLSEDWPTRWDTLSHGERKRAQIATALWQKPDVLAIDEPTNHLDTTARELLARALRAYEGVGLLVSHDRELLDTLCGQCLFLHPPTATLRPGGYTAGAEQAQQELTQMRAQRQHAARELRRVEAELVRRREKAAREHKDRSKRGLARWDTDGRARIDAARVADSKAGAPLRQMQGRAAQAAARLASIQVEKHVELGIWLDEARARAGAVLRLPPGEIAIVPSADAMDARDKQVARRDRSETGPTKEGAAPAAGPTGHNVEPDVGPTSAGVQLGDGARRLVFPELCVTPTARVALVGPNGAGKSTLVRHLLTYVALPPERVLYMPQELATEASREVAREVQALPNATLGRVLQIIRRLGSDPERLLETELPSPGETRKLLLALGILRSVHLIIMDEPTNHLDLPSIECVEGALRDYPGALLLVSHDERFLKALTTTRWELQSAASAVETHVVIGAHS